MNKTPCGTGRDDTIPGEFGVLLDSYTRVFDQKEYINVPVTCPHYGQVMIYVPPVFSFYSITPSFFNIGLLSSVTVPNDFCHKRWCVYSTMKSYYINSRAPSELEHLTVLERVFVVLYCSSGRFAQRTFLDPVAPSDEWFVGRVR